MTNLYIIDNKASRSSVYGIGSYIDELSKSLRQSDMRVCLIHLNSDICRFFQEVDNGVAHWHIPCPKIKYKDEDKHNNLYFKNAVFFLRQYIQQADNLIFHINYPRCQPWIEALKEAFNCKVVLAVHYFSWCFDILGNVSRLRKLLEEPDASPDQLSKRVKKTFDEEKEALHTVDRIVCLSKHTADILQNLYRVEKQKISVIYNGLEDMAMGGTDRALTRKKYQLPEAPVIIFAGRLDPVKGLSYFMQASGIVLEHFPHCHIIIAGSGDYDTYMKECGGRWMNIHFTGLLEKSELYELYAIADFGVMPSLHEQCSYVAIEMMMHGLPIIASTSTGLLEMVEEGVTGLHVPVEEFEDKVDIDVSLLAEKMLYMLENEPERKQMGDNARKRYKSLYSSGKMGEKMIELYQSLNV
jgi:glycosyltransferase